MEYFIIALREGVEAALVVGIIIAYLQRTGRTALIPRVWLGIVAAVAASVAGAFILPPLFEEAMSEEAYEGIVMLIAAALIATFIIWMARAGRQMGEKIRERVDALSAKPGLGLGVALFAFLMVFREGVEMVLLGYNTPSVNSQNPTEGPSDRLFHNKLVMQSGAYQNSTWVVGIAKAGIEDGFPMIGGSMIVDPNGKVAAEAETDDDELIVHACDLDDCVFGKETIFDFGRHRRIEHYGIIAEQTGVIEPGD